VPRSAMRRVTVMSVVVRREGRERKQPVFPIQFVRGHVSEIPKLNGSGTRIFVGFPDTELSSTFRQFGERVSDTPEGPLL